MDTTRPERPSVRPAPRRRGWIPLGLPARILLTGLLVPAASVAPRACGDGVEQLGRLGRAVGEQAERGCERLTGWAAGALDPSTRAGDSARDERWASGR